LKQKFATTLRTFQKLNWPVRTFAKNASKPAAGGSTSGLAKLVASRIAATIPQINMRRNIFMKPDTRLLPLPSQKNAGYGVSRMKYLRYTEMNLPFFTTNNLILCIQLKKRLH